MRYSRLGAVPVIGSGLVATSNATPAQILLGVGVALVLGALTVLGVARHRRHADRRSAGL